MWYKEDLYSRYHYVDYIAKHKNLISNHTNFGVFSYDIKHLSYTHKERNTKILDTNHSNLSSFFDWIISE